MDISIVLISILTPKFLVLYVFIVSVVFVHYRGQIRHRFLRQLTDHSTFMAPINLFMYLFSAVPTKPMLEADQFSDLRKLRERWEMIRDEATDLLEKDQIKASQKYDDLAFNSFFRKGWKRYYIKWYGNHLPSARRSAQKRLSSCESFRR